MVEYCVLFEVRAEFLKYYLDYQNVFSLTLFLSEGRAGVAWEPSNKMMLFLPPLKMKCLSLLPLIFALHLLFIYLSHLSLSNPLA
jgi:hypothetical protein